MLTTYFLVKRLIDQLKMRLFRIWAIIQLNVMKGSKKVNTVNEILLQTIY